MHRRIISGLALGTLALAPLATTPATAADAPTASPIKIKLPARVTGYRHDGRTEVFTQPQVVAGAEPFELRATRHDYSQPISTTWKRPGGDVDLGTDTVREWYQGLPAFVRVTITNSAGRVYSNRWHNWCVNSWDSQRVVPSAPARNPYPEECPYNPYTEGAVMGLQSGWSGGGLESFVNSGTLYPGSYKVTATINPKYVTMFGIAPEDATSTSTLRVVRGYPDEGDFSFRRSEGRVQPDVRQRRAESRPPQPNRTEPVGSQDAPAGTPTPDLRVLPAWGVGMTGRTTVGFAATVWNGGDSPLVVDGFHRDAEPVMDAYQYFFDADGEQVGYEPVGTMEWDDRASHQHWHFTDFAVYDLVKLDDQGNVTRVLKSSKEAFCLANTDAIDYTLPNADWRPDGTDLGSACGEESSLSVREVLSAGSGDTYSQIRAGQAFNVKGLPNGNYWIRVTANPEGNLVESDSANNVSLRRIFIGGTATRRTVRMAQVGVIDESDIGFW